MNAVEITAASTFDPRGAAGYQARRAPRRGNDAILRRSRSCGTQHDIRPHRSTMSFNTFGHLFRVTTFGESHGPAIGCVVDGCPPRIPLSEARYPALSRSPPPRPIALHDASARNRTRSESSPACFWTSDTAQQVTTGTPIALLIDNVDQRPKDYSDISDKFRPGHADYTYRREIWRARLSRRRPQSARETAMRVAAGAVARKVLAGCAGACAARSCRWARTALTATRWDWDEVERNPFFCPDAERGTFFAELSRRRPQARLVRAAPSSKSSPRACRRASARRSTASSTPISPPR